MKANKLPVDIFLEVIVYLDPLDVYSVRKTCKQLSALTYERAVWQRLLESHCGKYNLFRPSYDIASMTAAQLEAIVVRPLRVASSLRKTAIPEPPDDFMPIESYIPSALGEYFEMVQLIPGGRYVVTVARCTPGRALEVWDLLQGAQEEQFKVLRAGAVARTVLEGSSTGVHCLQTCAHGSRLRILLQASGNTINCWSLYEVDLLHVAPEITMVATQNVGRFDSMGHYSDLRLLNAESVVFFSYRGIVYWHVGRDSVVEWIFPDGQRVNSITALDNLFILSYSNGDVKAAQLPDDPLSNTDFESLLSDYSVPVVTKLERPTTDDPRISHLWPFPRWRHTQEVRLDLVATVWTESVQGGIAIRFVFDHCTVSVRKCDSDPEISLEVIATSDDLVTEDFMGFCSGWITDEDHLLTWQDDREVFGRYMSIRPSGDRQTKRASRIFTICEAQIPEVAHSTCPTSGLVAVISAPPDVMVPRNWIGIRSVL